MRFKLSVIAVVLGSWLTASLLAAQLPTNVLNSAADLAGKTLVTAEGARTISGVWTFTVPIKAVAGNATAPGLASAADATTGWALSPATITGSIGGAGSQFALNGSGLFIYGTNIVNTNGKIPALSTLYFETLTGSQLTSPILITPNIGVASATRVLVGTSAAVSMDGDLGVSRNAAATQGAIYFGSTSAVFLYYDATLFNFSHAIKIPGGATLISTSTALTNNAAAQTATMTNAPTAGNPTKWVAVNDNGTTRYMPLW